MVKNIFVVGRDDFNFRTLESMPSADEYNFHGLLDLEDIRAREPTSLNSLVESAEAQLDQFDGRVDAIVGYWDFPITDLVPILCERHDLPSASLKSVLQCEHKYWSRVEEQKIAPDLLPRFVCVNPFDEDQVRDIPLQYPYWIKPVKSFASYLGFRIKNKRDLDEAIPIIQKNIGRLGGEFNEALERVEMPPELEGIDGMHCIAEEIISGRQCTLEGYGYGQDVDVYGIVDSFRASNRSTFSRYQYPSQLSRSLQARMVDATKNIMSHIGYEMAPFNVEFFYDDKTEQLKLLEINPRISQSHCDLFAKVDGASHHEVMIQLGLGERPTPRRREGQFNCAAKFFMRHFGDAVVTRVPGQQEIDRVRNEIPGTLVNLIVDERIRLSELQHQDSYSFELAHVYIGAQNQRELLRKQKRAFELLSFDFAEEQKKAS